MKGWQSHLAAALAGSAITGFCLIPYISTSAGEAAPRERHAFETSIQVPVWCEDQAEQLIAQDRRVSVEFYPVDIQDNWKSGVHQIALASGSIEERDRAARLIQSACTGQQVTLYAGDEAEFIAEQLEDMREQGVRSAVLLVEQGKLILQIGTNIGAVSP